MRLHGEDGSNYYLLCVSAHRERKLYSILVNFCLRFPDENALRPQQTEIKRTDQHRNPG